MSFSNEIAIDLLKIHEGFRSHPYKCTSGKLTIGYGWNLEDRGITESEAEYILSKMVSEIIIKLKGIINNFYGLNTVRQAVLIDMAYQLGIMGLSKFKNMINAIQDGDFLKASEEMLGSKWAKKDSPNRAHELSLMIRTGNII